MGADSVACWFSVMDDELDVRKHQGRRNLRMSITQGNLYRMRS